MKYLIYSFIVLLSFSCQNTTKMNLMEKQIDSSDNSSHYILVFASCNDQNRKQPLWKPIIENHPSLFIWGGDNIYADTDDMSKMKNDYDKVWANPDYASLAEKTTIIGTWDDHDYGINDGGVEWGKKEEAKNLFLDFLKVPEDDIRRNREGVYTSETFKGEKGSIKVILLDTRTFRDSLKPSSNPDWTYDVWDVDHGGTILGTDQWQWLKEELKDDTATFTLIVTSIQFLSDQHGWEKWANFPNEVVKMKQLLKDARARNIVILSGDRHLAEISLAEIDGMDYPLIDFTTSGLTHTYIDTSTEANPYRISNVIKRLNFGLLRFDFDHTEIMFEIRGEDNFLYEQFVRQY
jgi:alkaline phosphatase D